MSELKLNNWKDLDFGNPISGNIFCADPTVVEFEGRLYVYVLFIIKNENLLADEKSCNSILYIEESRLV